MILFRQSISCKSGTSINLKQLTYAGNRLFPSDQIGQQVLHTVVGLVLGRASTSQGDRDSCPRVEAPGDIAVLRLEGLARREALEGVVCNQEIGVEVVDHEGSVGLIVLA